MIVEMKQDSLLRPAALRAGDTIGVCTPSFPAHVAFREKYLHGVRQLEDLGFRVVEGALTRLATAQGYRAGSPRERAAELNQLFAEDAVRCIITTIGGTCSSSLIPHLDFDLIRKKPKIFCGYSDITSLHLAILAYAGLSTFYGPAVMPSFGEWPSVLPETRNSFLVATSSTAPGERELVAPPLYSRHVRDAKSDAWKTVPRIWLHNPGLRTIYSGVAEGPCLVANLNTLVTAAGTDYFPELAGRVLVIEEMNAPLSEEERDLRHLERLGVFDEIAGLVIGKPEVYSNEDAPFEYADLVREIVPQRRDVPVVMEADVGHTVPMLTLAQETRLRISARIDEPARLFVLEPMVRD
jgi:muramoyltetrapeptide carboxypeptidase LdcA involved in peptidoglycan recycling